MEERTYWSMRAECIELDLPYIVSQHKRYVVARAYTDDKATQKYLDEVYYEYEKQYMYFKVCDSDLVDMAERMSDAERSKIHRLSKRIKEIMNGSDMTLFLTLTFRDEVLAATSQETRKKYVQKFLKAHSINYVGNIDFGSKNEREHYHAVIGITQKINYTDWSYGACNGERVVNYSDSKRLARYVSKLTNHAVKETVRKNKIIYSRAV